MIIHSLIGGSSLDVAVELVFGPIYHRWILRTHPFDEPYADALTGLAVRALSGLAAEAE
ncbi:hypothetical protein [Kribbella lupini]|uniref:Tetracyclin repressor-like C-terminal domain-containing protein n=1 Tax=Kribbella lupini TaxID=291602 RepID=A0ABP4LAE5_9ACTN